MSRCRFGLILLLLLAATSSVFASYISLNTTVSAQVEGRQLKVEVAALNKGDEAAHGVQAEIRAAGRTVLAPKVNELGIDQAYKTTKLIDLTTLTPGRYPLVAVMHYADANQYPFSALTAQTYTYRSEDLPAQVFGRIKGATFWQQGEIKLSLKNMGEWPVAAQTYLVTPRELTVNEEKVALLIAPKAESQKKLLVRNFSALSGSTYQIFAVSEYDSQGLHQTTIAPGTIKIVERKNVLGIDFVYLAAALAVLILLFALSQIFKR